MSEFATLADAIARSVRPGDRVALEGFTHLIPFAAGHEIIRQGIGDLTLVRMTPDLLYDQMIGSGCARKLVFSWGGNPGVGSLHRLRDAVERGWPQPLEIEEHSHSAMAHAYAAGAAGMPCAIFKGYLGSDLARVNPNIKFITCPFTGESLASVPALRPDVAIVHAQKADRAGNVLVEGIVGVQKEAVLASAQVDRHRRGDRGSVRGDRHERRHPALVDGGRGRARAGRRAPVCTRTATTRATTRSTSRGTRSPGTATRFARGSTGT